MKMNSKSGVNIKHLDLCAHWACGSKNVLALQIFMCPANISMNL